MSKTTSKLNWLDRTISFLAPKTGLDRARARHVIRVYENLLGKKYEGATRGRRTKGWVTSASSADAEHYAAAGLLRDRARDLVRNNPYAASGVGVIQTNVVGPGILCQVRPSPLITGKKPGKLDVQRAAEAQAAWNAWADSNDCDADGEMNFYGLQSLVMRVVAESGECLVRRRRRRADSGLSTPLQIQVLEPDYIDSTRNNKLPDGGAVINGIEFDKNGVRRAYMMFTEHPGGQTSTIGFVRNTIRVDASEIIHIFRKDRAGQTRGVSWFAPVMLRLRDFDEYEDAQLVRQKMASCYMAFVREIETGEMTDDEQNLAQHLEPGIIELLPPGKDITFATPPEAKNYAEYTSVVLRSISKGLGVSYESLTGDFSQVNFSSARMGAIEMQRNVMSWQWNMLIPLFCEGVYSWFTDTAYYQGLDFEGLAHSWTPPARQLIDPLKESQAAKTAIRAGLMTLSEAVRERGYDPEIHFQEYAQDLARLDKLGIVLDTDARRTAVTGVASDQSAPAQANADAVDTGVTDGTQD